MAGRRRFSLGVIILAAGRSSRMGRPKMLLPWGRTTVLGHLLALWSRLGAHQVAVVCASADAAIDTELNRLRFSNKNRITNPDPGQGMFSSVQCAARWRGWNPGLTHWAIVLGDQPHLQRATLATLLDAAAQHPPPPNIPGKSASRPGAGARAIRCCCQRPLLKSSPGARMKLSRNSCARWPPTWSWWS